MYVTSRNKDNPYSIEITDWKEAGLMKPLWARIDRIINISEWHLDKKIGQLSQTDLIKILQLVAEITTGVCHEFSLIAVQRNDNRFLQIYDDRWHGWLFPYFRSTDNNKENVDFQISKLLENELVTFYVTQSKHCKFSVSDKVYKIYNHKLYTVKLEKVPENMNKNSFEINNKKFQWMSINEMENDNSIMEINDDVVAFVKAKCS